MLGSESWRQEVRGAYAVGRSVMLEQASEVGGRLMMKGFEREGGL